MNNMIPRIYDCKDGINLEFDMENGLSIMVYMDDDAAEQMIGIIQNKLNARYKR